MTIDEREKMRERVNGWKETGKVLERLRREEIRNSNLEETILALGGTFQSALWLSPLEKTSGFIEFHRVLAKSR